MPDDSNGNYTLPNGYRATDGQTALASQHNPPLEDIEASLTDRLSRVGRGAMLADLNFGGFKGVGAAAATASSDLVNLGQIPGLVAANPPATHTHTSAAITDFATAVDGRADARIATAVGNAAFNEAVDDRANVLLQVGTGLSKTYDDGAGTLTLAITGAILPAPGLIVVDTYASGTAGTALGSISAWGNRPLNTVSRNVISGASLASNQITLPAGDYYFEAVVSQGNSNQAYRLQNITDGATAINGPYVQTSGSSAVFSGFFTIAGSKTFGLQHFGNGSNPTTGNAASISGRNEIYSIVNVWKVG